MKVNKVVVRLGIDLGKSVFCLFGVKSQGEPVARNKFGCGKMEQDVRIMGRQFIKPYVIVN